jgi:polysaccharide biosynthesis PFTS motif protein
MKKNIIGYNFFSKIKHSNFKKIYKEIKIIKKIIGTNSEIIHYKIFNNISKSNIYFKKSKKNIFTKNFHIDDLDLCIKQFVLFRIICIRELVKKIAISLGSGKKLCHPIPKEFRKFFTNEGIKFNNFRCNLELSFFCMREIIKGVCEVFKIFFEFKNSRTKKHIQFCSIPSDYNPNIEINKIDDVIFWFSKNYFKNNQSYDEIYCNNKFNSFYRKDIKIYGNGKKIPQLSFFRRVYFLFWSFFFLFFCFMMLLRGSWYYSLLSFEFILSKKVQLSDDIAREFFFSNSEYLYRPLWTYEAVKKGSNVSLYFYSSSFLGYRLKGMYLPNEAGTECMNWPNIIVWTKPLLNYFKKEIKNKNINFKFFQQPISHTDANLINLKKNKKNLYLLVYDVPPRRNSIRSQYMMGDSYRTELNGINFLRDIKNIALKKNIIILLKPKRKLDKEYSRKYIKFYQSLLSDDKIFIFDHQVSNSKLIQISDAVISIPWTSTAFIAKYYNKPSIFYDPTSKLDRKDRGRQGVDLIKGVNELESWLRKVS